MKKVICPPCGAEFSSDSDEDLVKKVQEHAKTFHGETLSREDILKAAKVV